MNNCKIINNSGMKIDDEIHSLVNFTKERFGFKRPPTIFLNNDDQNASKTLAMTGYYDPESMEIHVYTTGRHPKDILRSIAHELVHHNQNENGDFENAGYSGKGYAQKNPHLRKMELQANDPMLFRDWEDSLKEKYPTIYNEGRTNTMSFKDWKNKELSKNLTNRWGFKMDLTKLNEAHCGGDHDKADESHCMEEEQLEEKKGDCPECKNAKEDCVCPDKKKKMEEEEIKNPGKYIDGERTKAGVDDDGDGVPNKADKDPKDGSKK